MRNGRYTIANLEERLQDKRSLNEVEQNQDSLHSAKRIKTSEDSHIPFIRMPPVPVSVYMEYVHVIFTTTPHNLLGPHYVSSTALNYMPPVHSIYIDLDKSVYNHAQKNTYLEEIRESNIQYAKQVL
jgi:hypothetical protein